MDVVRTLSFPVLTFRIGVSFNLFGRFLHLHYQLLQNAGLSSAHTPKDIGAGVK